MPKKKSKEAAQNPFPPQSLFGLAASMPQLKIKKLSIKATELRWSEFSLSDGSVLKVRPLIINVARQIGGFNPQGDPLYMLQTAFEIRTEAPERLKMGYLYGRPKRPRRKS